MNKELPKVYEPQKYEDEIYKKWEEGGFFVPENTGVDEVFSVMMPPPNVTGVLHLGHALENSLMDTFVRFQRMQGKKTLLLPGTDHAAVATQARVEKNLVAEGIDNPREHFGRGKLLEKIREYAEESKATILNQIRKMGTSCDWSRLAYTFDEQRNTAVNKVFKKMYDDGLIYRGYRVVNWSVLGQSTASDDELVHVERKGQMYTFKYSADFPFPIATTRPETKLGDTAVAVNPNDKRYKKYIGKIIEVKGFGGSVDLSLKVIADENVDPDFGTGALGVTPAHSGVDFEMYERMKKSDDSIELIEVIGKDGKMTDKAGDEYKGMEVVQAREKVVEWLEKNNLLEKTEEVDQNISTSDRFGDIVEALPMTQWFVDVNKQIAGKGKSLKELMKEAVKVGHKGDKKQKINITPQRFEKIYYNWIDNLRDWCISRQIWWGHRIPVWYKDDEIFVGVDKPDENGWQQDTDTLDTWFSSGLWTFSTLGWPDDNDDMKQFHPTSWMQMGHEILFFWMARMILMSTYVLDAIPFKDVYIHGILRDKDGKKFSKSAGNGIDPIDVINEYGCDALRISLMSGISPGNDSRFYEEKVEGSRNLINKLWNICRFMLMSIEEPQRDVKITAKLTLSDSWILNKLDDTVKEVTNNFNKYNFSYAAEVLREFTWNELADWYLEIAKIEGDKEEVLNHILNTILKLWHPFTPFVTEAIWQEVYGVENSIMISKWPDSIDNKDAIYDFDLIQNIITNIRSLRADYKIDPAKKLKVVISAGKKLGILKENTNAIQALARLESIQINKLSTKPINSIGFVEGGVDVYIDIEGIIDLEKEKTRLEQETREISEYMSSLEKKLSNKQFVDNAPEEVVVKEKEKYEEAKQKGEKLKKQLNNLI